MALRYPNKRKRAGYWKNYENAGIKDRWKVWNFLDEVVDSCGLPFQRASRGRRPKLDLRHIAKIIVYMAYFDCVLREAETDLRLFVGETIDHTNIDRWFWKVDDLWIRDAVQMLHEKIEAITSDGEYVSDSTGIATDRYYETTALDSDGNPILALLTIKLHIMIVYFASIGLVSIANHHVTHGDANDNPVMNEYLLENVRIRQGRRHHADKGYWGKKNLQKNKELGLRPNIVPKEGWNKGLILLQGIKEYDNDARKANRGLVEGVFGGLTTLQGTKTRFRKDCARKTHVALLPLTHNIRTCLRALLIRIITYFATTP